MRKLEAIQKNPEFGVDLKKHYRHAPWDLISDWGMTFEPRNLELGLITAIPFVLWKRQREYLQWLHTRWKRRERGLVEKSRDCGVTWLTVGFGVAMWIAEDGFLAGFGSRKEELVDKRGDDKSIFEKIRFFIDNLPPFLQPAAMNRKNDWSHLRISNSDNGSALIGEAGDQIGRGGRASIYFVDEAAFVEHQLTVDAALSQTTNCQIDISTPNGSGNAFYKKRLRFNNTDRIFIFDWRDDPRKDQAWYDRQVEEQDEVTVAQEIDRDYNASKEDSFIPAKWVAAAVDAHIRLGFRSEGIKVTSFDPADTGDARSVVNRYGSVVLEAEQMTKGNITNAIPWAVEHGVNHRADVFIFDGDGLGTPTIKMALQVPALRARIRLSRMNILVFRGSGAVQNPGQPAGKRTHKESEALKSNIDTYLNFRAQAWSWVRARFEKTFDAVEAARAGKIVRADPEDLISINSKCAHMQELVAELSRPLRIYSANGKIQVESKESMKKREIMSPNLADALVMAFSVSAPSAPTTGGIKTQEFAPLDPSMGY
ncbi:MAG: TerL protein [Gammaproteobacteria bacterium]|nr:TerL protein [Gammaproteobacteria bacterium]